MIALSVGIETPEWNSDCLRKSTAISGHIRHNPNVKETIVVMWNSRVLLEVMSIRRKAHKSSKH